MRCAGRRHARQRVTEIVRSKPRSCSLEALDRRWRHGLNGRRGRLGDLRRGSLGRRILCHTALARRRGLLRRLLREARRSFLIAPGGVLHPPGPSNGRPGGIADHRAGHSPDRSEHHSSRQGAERRGSRTFLGDRGRGGERQHKHHSDKRFFHDRVPTSVSANDRAREMRRQKGVFVSLIGSAAGWNRRSRALSRHRPRQRSR